MGVLDKLFDKHKIANTLARDLTKPVVKLGGTITTFSRAFYRPNTVHQLDLLYLHLLLRKVEQNRKPSHIIYEIVANFFCQLIVMKIVEENALKIFPTKQSIDQCLGLPPPFADRNQVIVCCGGQASGKSTWLNSALTCRKKDGKIFAGCYERVFYATPEECFYGSEKEHPMAKHIKSRLFHQFNVDMLTKVAEQALENKHENEGNNILIIDDFSEELKNIETIKLLKKLINKNRHLNLTILISALTMKSIPKSIRQLVDVFVIFKPKSLIEIDDYVTEIFAMKPNEMQRLLDFVFDKPHNFLMYFNRTNQFYKNFDRITL